jgi:hypothetical protein
MKRLRLQASIFALAAVVIFGAAGSADAQRRNEREVRDIVRSLNSKIDDFKFGVDYQMRSSSANSQDVDDLTRSVGSLQSRVDQFDENLRARRENRDDVTAIIEAAKDVDSFIKTNRQNQRIEADWFGVRDLIGRLASNYGVTPDWSGRMSTSTSTTPRSNYPTYSSGSASLDNGLTGTYSLDANRSEKVADVIGNTSVSGDRRQDLASKLEAPSQIALLVRGDQITIASSNASPASFRADGSEKLENIDGRDVRLRATLRGNSELTISSVGGATDYTVGFVSEDNGRTLKVTRRITTDYLPDTIFAESVYTKTDAAAGLGIDANPADSGVFSSNDPGDTGRYPSPTISSGRTGDFIVPNGSIVTAILDNEINTEVSQNNDRFRMIVQSPDEFRGATIEGYLSGVGRSGQISGRSNVTFNFERITLRNGQSYEFGGVLQSVKDQNGKLVKVDTEGTAKGDSQTKETATRGGIGAGLGAIIGAIAGGGKGAVIGAIIGGGAGAGSVIVQGRDDVRLLKGSTITVQASSPIRPDRPVSEN